MTIFNYNHLFELGQKVQESFMTASWALLGLYALFCMVQEFILRFRNEGDFFKIILRLFICVVLLTNIVPIRNFFYDRSIDLADYIYSEDQIKRLEMPLDKQQTQKSSTGVVDWVRNTLLDNWSRGFLLFFKGLYWIVSLILMFIRNFGHFIVYITAPLAIIFFLSDKTQYITISFFKRFLALCLWPVFISAIYLVMASLTASNFKLGFEATGLIESIAYLLILTLLLVAVPLFASQFVSGLWGVAEAGIMHGAFNMISMPALTSPIKLSTKIVANTTRYLKDKSKVGSYALLTKTLTKSENKVPSLKKSSIYNKTKLGISTVAEAVTYDKQKSYAANNKRKGKA